MAERKYESLAEAVCSALQIRGERVLRHPKVLLGHILDFMDPDSVDLHVLERTCDEGLLRPFIKQLDIQDADLDVAAMQARLYLSDVCVVDEGAAMHVADGIAEGIAKWKGLPLQLERDEERYDRPQGDVAEDVRGAGDRQEEKTPDDTEISETDKLDMVQDSPGREMLEPIRTRRILSVGRIVVTAVVAIAVMVSIFVYVRMGTSTSSTEAGDGVREMADAVETETPMEQTDDVLGMVTVNFYDEEGGEIVQTEEVEPGSKVVIPALEREGSTLQRWDYDGNILYGLHSGDEIVADRDMDVFAVWKSIVSVPEGISVELISPSDTKTVRNGPDGYFASEPRSVLLVNNESKRDRKLSVEPGRPHELLGTFVIAAGKMGVFSSEVSDSYEVKDWDSEESEDGPVARKSYDVTIREVDVGAGALTIELGNLESLGKSWFEVGVLAVSDDDVIFCDGSISYEGVGDVATVQFDKGGSDISWQNYERRYFVEGQLL